MDNALPSLRLPSLAQWRELVLPKEHGSWSLALEPLVFGLLAAPSGAGGWLALAVVAGFFARRPLRIAWRDPRPERRRDAAMALAGCGLAGALSLVAAVVTAGAGWMIWLVPSAIAGGLFLSFDLRNGGREEMAEVAGSAAFALLPAALGVIAGAAPGVAVALAVVMTGRAIPTVLSVRAALRGAKTGNRRPLPALVAAFAAWGAAAWMHRHGLVPAVALVALGALAWRTFALLVYPRPAMRARTMGMIEAVVGLAFVAIVGCAWGSLR
jgi:hypothetical protein